MVFDYIIRDLCVAIKQKREPFDSRDVTLCHLLSDYFFEVFFGSSIVASAGLNKASFFIKRPLRRAALFLWITPFPAALSNSLIAFKMASFVSGAFFSNAARAWLTAVRAPPRVVRLISRRFSVCLFRLI
jgi:hypothetical protein